MAFAPVFSRPFAPTFDRHAAAALPLYCTDFSEYNTGQLPTPEWSNDARYYVVSGAYTGGKAVENNTLNTLDNLSWLALGQFTNFQVYSRLAPGDSGGSRRVAGLGLNSDPCVGFSKTGGVKNQLVYSNDGVTIVTAVAYDWSATWQHLRVEIIGTSLKARAWPDGSAEPETWFLTYTISTGPYYVGLAAMQSGQPSRWDTFCVQTL